MAMIGIANSRNSNDPEPPSGETPNILSIKSMSPPDISKLLAVILARCEATIYAAPVLTRAY
jgi:hypothetical protein